MGSDWVGYWCFLTLGRGAGNTAMVCTGIPHVFALSLFFLFLFSFSVGLAMSLKLPCGVLGVALDESKTCLYAGWSTLAGGLYTLPVGSHDH